MERRTLRWCYLGQVAYDEGAELQKTLSERLAGGTGSEYLLLLEHPHVYTLGRSAGGDDVLADTGWLEARGVEVAETNRGGQVTYHGPGQLVGYPIIDLKPDRRDVRRYVHDLQRVLVETLSEYGVEARGEGTQAMIGVWAGPQKIASIGVHLSRWITTNGFALNVTTDLGFFAGIVPCGLTDVSMASIETLTGVRPPLEEVAARAAVRFGEVFGRDLVQCDPDEIRQVAVPPAEASSHV
jgi:lipoyl(octanoyl) transferase